MDKITVYTDGSALSNGRPGSGCGWACKLMYKGQARMKSGGAIGETNNRMEMQAVLEAKGMFGTIVQGYLKNGYNRVTAEMMAREFFRYES